MGCLHGNVKDGAHEGRSIFIHGEPVECVMSRKIPSHNPTSQAIGGTKAEENENKVKLSPTIFVRQMDGKPADKRAVDQLFEFSHNSIILFIKEK